MNTKRLGILILMFILIASVIYFFIDYNVEHKKWKRKEYQGIIKGIFPNAFHAGQPQIKINNHLIQLEIVEQPIFNYIQIGDSIVKSSGSEIISVFRKDENGKWVVKQFDCSEKTVRM